MNYLQSWMQRLWNRVQGRARGRARYPAAAAALASIAVLAGCTAKKRSSEYGRLTATPILDQSSTYAREASTWRRLRSEHLELVTDYPLNQALEALRVFERAEVYLDQVLPYGKPKRNSPLMVVLFRDPKELQGRSANPMAVCTFMVRAPGALHRRPMILAAGDNTLSMRLHWVHELSHYELYRRFGALPAWLDEGLAAYFSSIEDLGQQVLVGTPQRLWRFVDDGKGMRTEAQWTHSRTAVPRTWFLDASELVRTDYFDFHTSMGRKRATQGDIVNEVVNYAESWLMVHMLFHGPSRYRALMDNSVRAHAHPLGWGDRLMEQLLSIDPNTLDRDLATYASSLSTPAIPVPMPSYWGAQVRIERLSPEEALHVRASTLAKPESLYPQLEEILQHQPPSPRTLLTKAWMLLRKGQSHDAGRALCSAKSLLSKEPRSDPETQAEWLHLGLWIDVELRRQNKALSCAPDRSPSQTAWAQELALNARNSAQMHSAAQVLGAYGHLDAAYAAGQKAIAADPSCWSCYESLAQISYRQGSTEYARHWQTRALEWTPGAMGQKYRKDQLSTLARYKQPPKAASAASRLE